MRGPCWTCRKRTIQCDQSRFPCAKCEKAGLDCLDKRPLRWVKGVAIRGKMRGRDFDNKKPQLGQFRRKQLLPDSANGLLVEAGPPPTLQDSHISSVERFYIDYYEKRVCKLYILYDSDTNPFRKLLPYALEDVALQKSIVALAARHFANTGYSFGRIEANTSHQFEKAELNALQFKRQTIDALSRSLSNAESCKKDATLATILLLIFLDLLESGIDGWSLHIQGAKVIHQVLARLGANSNAELDRGETATGIRQFITRQLFLIETLGTAFSSSTPVFENLIEDQESIHHESIVRSFLGCPEFILRAISFFSNQRTIIIESRRDDSAVPIRDTVTMLQLTEEFDCFEWALNFQQPETSSTKEINQLCILSQAYKNAALLYGRQVLGASWTDTTRNEELVSQLLGLVETLKNNATLFKCLLWPTFMAGLGSHTQSQNDAVITLLERLWDSTNCLNVISASKLLNDYWKRNDQKGTRMPGTSGIDELAYGWLLI
ncbi:fungal-specific transcription factor domain-containing protein [Trichoderma austrokoningii]